MSEYYYHTRDIGGDICYYKKRKGDKLWSFTNKEDYELHKGMKKHFYKGGEVERYNKWKSIDWDSFKLDSKSRSNIYRLLGWFDSERIDLIKISEEDLELYEDFVSDILDGLTFEYFFSEVIENLEKRFELLMYETKAETDEGVEELLKGKYKDIKVDIDNLGIKWKDLVLKSNEEILEEIRSSKDLQWIIDYIFLNDDNWYEFTYSQEYNFIDKFNKLYNKVLDNGAVFTEEAEQQQYDIFAEVPAEISKEKKEEPKEVLYISYLNKDKGFKEDKKYFSFFDEAQEWGRANLGNFNTDMIRYEDAKVEELDENKLVQEINSELSMLNELLDDAKEDSNKELISELEDRIEFLEELRDDALPFENGGLLKDYKKIIVKFNDNYTPVRLDFYVSQNSKDLIRIGGATSSVYLDSSKVLNLQEINLDNEYNNPKDMELIISAIKKNLRKETGKTQLMIKKSIQ